MQYFPELRKVIKGKSVLWDHQLPTCPSARTCRPTCVTAGSANSTHRPHHGRVTPGIRPGLMPGVTGSRSGHTIGVETGHTGVTVMETGHTCVFPHEYIVDGSSSLSESVSSSFIAQHRHACSAMLIATSRTTSRAAVSAPPFRARTGMARHPHLRRSTRLPGRSPWGDATTRLKPTHTQPQGLIRLTLQRIRGCSPSLPALGNSFFARRAAPRAYCR